MERTDFSRTSQEAFQSFFPVFVVNLSGSLAATVEAEDCRQSTNTIVY